MPDIEAQIQLDRVEVLDCAKCSAVMDVADLNAFTEVECPQCGERQTVPAKLGQFTLLNMINTGGMGAVYRARDDSLGRLVAIKVMLKKLGEDPKVVEDFKREAQAAARLNHPNVAQIYSFGQAHSQPYIVMELVSGKRFDKMIEERSTLDPAIVMKVAADIAEGLQAADGIGLVHGDVKPENILLDEKNNAKLVDFGIASFADQAAPDVGIWGTPYYIAPEKVKRKKSDARSDIFSLGATIYHALSGKPPFDGATPADVVRARLEKTPIALKEINANVPAALSDTVARMLEKEPARRHPTYASLIGDLRRELDEYSKKRTGALNAGMTGKRIRIKKPSRAAVVTESRAPTPAAPADGRLTVKVAKRAAAGKAAVSSVKQKTPEQTRLERKKRARARTAQAVVIGILLLLVGGGVIGALIKNSHDKKMAELGRRSRLRVARDECDQLVSTLKQHRDAVDVTGKRIEPLLVTIAEVVQFVEGRPLKSFYSGNRRQSTLMPAVDGEGTTPAAPSPAAADAPAAKPDGPVLDEEGREAPFGGVKRRAQDSRRATMEEGAEQSAVAAAPAAKPDGPVLDEEGREAPFEGGKRQSDDSRRATADGGAEKSAVAAAPAAKPDGPILDEDGREAPFGGVSRAADDRRRATADAPSGAPAAPKPAAAKSGDAKPGDAAPADTNQVDDIDAIIAMQLKVRDPIAGSEVVVLADRVVIYSERIDQRLLEVETRVNDAAEMRAVAEEAMDPAMAESQITNITAHLEFVQRSKDEMSDWINEAKELTAKVSAIGVATRLQRERDAKLAKERTDAEAHAKLVESERQSVKDLDTQCRAQVVSGDFDKAMASAEALMQNLQTDQAKADLGIVIDRVKLISGTRSFLIAEINKEPFRWGWRTAAGQREDIVAADLEGISIRTSRIPWKDVDLPRLSQLITHYVEREGIKPTEKGNMFMGLSFLCRLHGRASAADQFESKASFASPYAQEMIERLRP